MPDGNYDPAADLAPVYEDAGKRYDLDPDFLRAQTNVESGGNPYAVSSAGAEGISQFIPSTASREGLRDPYDPREAIPAQAKLMRENANQFGSMPLAVAAYHGGTDPSAWGDKTLGYLDAVNAEYQRLKAARQPPAAAPAQAQQKAPGIADQITTARQAGYSDDEIASYLQQSKTWAPKFNAARQAGYLDSDVFQHFGLKVQEGTPLTNKQAVKQLPLAQTEAQAPLPLERRVAGAEPNTPPTAPPAKDTGWLRAFTAGLGSSIRGGAQTYQALAGGRPAASEPTVKAAEPIEWGDVSNPGLLGRKFLYGIAASAPQIAGFSAGAALAGGPETPIGLAAGAAGAAIAEAATSLGPSFGNELKASPQDPDGAFNRAMKQTGVGAAFTGLGFASFGIAPFEGALKNMVFQAFGVQPAVAVAQKGTENVMEGRPVGEDIYQGVPGAIAMTAAPLLAHAGARRLLGRGQTPEEAAPAAAGVGPPSAAPTTGTPAPEASVAQPRTMEEAALAELDPETHAAAADAHASLAEIAKEEGVEVPPMPKPKRTRKAAPAPEPEALEPTPPSGAALPSEPPIAESAAPEQPQIINMQGAGAAIAGNMRDAMWDKLQKGDLTEGGQPSDVLRAAQQNIESGAIKGRTDFDRFVDWWATGGREQKPAEQFGPPTPPWEKPGLNELEQAGPPAPPWQRPGLTERERLGPPEAPRQTREEAFQAQREAEQQSLQQAQSFADAGKPMRFRSSVFPDSTYLVSPSVDEGATPGQWRTTTFIGGKPEGHLDFPSATEAFNHVTSRGAEPDVPVPVPPITPLQERHAQVSAAEAERSRAAEGQSNYARLPGMTTPEENIRRWEEAAGVTRPEAERSQAEEEQTRPIVQLGDEYGGDNSGSLYSFPGALFDPAAYRRAFGAGPPGAPNEVLADKEGMAKAAAEIKAGFAPTSLRGAKPMEAQIRAHTSRSAQAHDIDVAALEKVRGAVDRLSQQEQIDFNHRMETGQAQPTPELQKVAVALRSMLDGWAQKIQGLGKGYLANAIENYMGHIWGNYREWSQGGGQPGRTQAQMQAGAMAANVRKQPLRGSGNFLKQRSFPTQLEGINAGLVPVTYNPVDLQLIKAHEMRKFYHGTVLADAIKAEGIAHWVRDSDAREALSNGQVPLDDKIFQPKLYGVTPIGPVEPGKWYAPEPAARIFNNYMSEGWANRSTIYDAMRQSNNALNSLQLGIGGFHAAFVTNDVATSKVALGIQQISRGELGRGGANLLFGAPIVGHAAALTDSLIKGGRVRREWLDPGSGSPEVQRVVNAIKAGGFRLTMPDFFRSSTSGPFFKHWNDLKNPGSVWRQSMQMFRDAPTAYQKAVMTPIRIAARALDTTMEPLMGALVPRAKAGVMYDLAADWLRRNPTATDQELSSAMTKFQDSVDNRLGQLNYDNLFWNKTMKDIAFITTRSVGWNLGTARELGGAVVDTGSALKALANGRAPQVSTRMAYALAMPVVTGMLGATLTYLATGQGPQSLLDYFYPPTGTDTDQGVQERRSIPGYLKDVISFAHDPIQTVLNKTSPMLEAVQELGKNRDYYGNIIYDAQRDRGPAQAYGDFLINQSTPFSLRSWGRLQGEGAPALDQAMGFFGFQPAPASITNPERAQKFQRKEELKAYKGREKAVAKGLSMHIFNTPTGARP